MNSTSTALDSAPEIPLPRVAGFVRQITHDVRNGLNAIDLQSAFIGEIAEDPEVVAEIAKLRGMVSHVTRNMQEISSRFGELRPTLFDYPVKEFLQGLRETVEQEFESQVKRLAWESKVPDGEEIQLDYTFLTTALVELVRNALYFREGDEPIQILTQSDGASIVFQVSQKRTQPSGEIEQWGRDPLLTSRRGGYGLGLYYVRRIVHALGGTLDAQYDATTGRLKVRLCLPRKASATN